MRAARFRALAEGSALGAYLSFLARIADVQHSAQQVLALPPELPAAELERRLQHAMPVLSSDVACGGAELSVTLDWMIRHTRDTEAPDAAQQAWQRLDSMAEPERIALAGALLEGAWPADRLGECLYVAAALQVHLASRAATLDAKRLKPVADGICPVCGNGPVASMIVGWASADRARYCMCSLCGTMWNHVRIKCTSCGDTQSISYYLVEDSPQEIGAETCSSCQTYIKHLHQNRNAQLEPFADDVASFGLDLLVQERGFRRAALNPFLIMGRV